MKRILALATCFALGVGISAIYPQTRIAPAQLPGLGVTIDAVTATSYTVACGNQLSNSDALHMKLFSNASSIAVSLFQAGTCGACGYVIYGGWYDADNNQISYVNNALLSSGATSFAAFNNNISNIYASPDAVHPNAIFAYTPSSTIHDNVVSESNGECVYFNFSDGTETDVYNNVLNCPNLPASILINTGDVSTDQPTATVRIMNNTIYPASGEHCIAGAGGTGSVGNLYVQNNFCISDGGSGAMLCNS
jgi:hypothetical protein